MKIHCIKYSGKVFHYLTDSDKGEQDILTIIRDLEDYGFQVICDWEYVSAEDLRVFLKSLNEDDLGKELMLLYKVCRNSGQYAI